MSRITARWTGGMRFDGMDADGRVVAMDTSPEHGGGNEGVRPTDLLLLSLAGCASMTLRGVLLKMHLDWTSCEVTVEADREERPPRVFTAIRVRYGLAGPGLTPEKVARAVELAGKYCSVANMLDKACPLSTSLTLNGQEQRIPG